MVKTIIFSITFPLLVTCVSYCQSRNDVVFGKVSKEEVIAGIHFLDKSNKTNVIRIDNVNEGPAFLIVISEEKVIRLDDFRTPDTIRVNHRLMTKIISYVVKNDSKIKERPKGIGTYRIVYRNKKDIGLYYVRGDGQSLKYFSNLSSLISATSDNNKHLTDQIKNIMRWSVKAE